MNDGSIMYARYHVNQAMQALPTLHLVSFFKNCLHEMNACRQVMNQALVYCRSTQTGPRPMDLRAFSVHILALERALNRMNDKVWNDLCVAGRDVEKLIHQPLGVARECMEKSLGSLQKIQPQRSFT